MQETSRLERDRELERELERERERGRELEFEILMARERERGREWELEREGRRIEYQMLQEHQQRQQQEAVVRCSRAAFCILLWCPSVVELT